MNAVKVCSNSNDVRLDSLEEIANRTRLDQIQDVELAETAVFLSVITADNGTERSGKESVVDADN